ncbi:serine hydrolase domain-containing protein [uncultured Methylobacterium sp.]|uniref:serine hydrolase domain-containing protein n=1 Tax=uncultured Methylobacterium sp. TaxID=157278 RepID=UPI0035CA4B19
MVLKRLLSAVALAGLVTGAHAQAAGDPLPRASPAEMGFSLERFARIGQVIARDVADGKLPGAVLAVARDGKLVALEAYGFRDKAAGVAMTTDTIFSIASMTKPMTTVAALTLAEQGRLVVDEPVSAYLPGRFAESKVAVLDEGGAMLRTVPASRPITVRDLLTHTSGLVYGGRGTTAVHRMYPAGSAAAAKALTGDQFLDGLSDAPLLDQPGATWDYGFGLDVTGLLVEALTCRSLGAYLSEAVFQPLGMTDTGFMVPPEKAARYARALPDDPATGRPQTLEPDSTKAANFACGGGCAVSTASDYLRFATMLLNEGEFSGHRVLSPAMTRFMLSNQLGPQVRNRVGSADPTRADYGFGLGLAVRTTPGVVRLLGSVGDFSWPGSTGTNWWVDPARRLVVVFMAHTPGPARWHYRYLINTLVYQAIER